MKKLFWGTLLLMLIVAIPIPTMARVDVNVSITLPPPIIFSTPPELIVLPETYIYVVPDVEADIFFYNGWWWRLWEGRWYRSRYYNTDWGYYRNVPSFYIGIPSSWRNDYRNHRWRGNQWNYQRIPHQQVQQNWKSWKNDRHWEKQNTWGVQGLKPQTQAPRSSPVAQPKSPEKPPIRETTKPQQSRPQVNPERSQQHPEAAPPSRNAARPQRPEAAPQSREVVQPQHQNTVPPPREVAKPKRPETAPQPREVQPQHSQPQNREAPHQSEPQHGRPERGGEERQERK